MFLTALALLAPVPYPQAALPELDAKTFASIIEYVIPTDDELRWRSIPWRPTLFDGLRDGAQMRKPVLLWAMNGHPLGTT